MNVLVIADDESLMHSLPDMHADILISCGDLPEELILKISKKNQCSFVLAVKGNHDSNAKFSNPIRDLHLQVIEVYGIKFGGFSGSWRYKPLGSHLYDQNEVEEALSSFPSVDVLLPIIPHALSMIVMMTFIWDSMHLIPTSIVHGLVSFCMDINMCKPNPLLDSPA